MSDIQLYLFEAGKNNAAAHDIAQRSAQKLEAKELKLIDLITSLQEYITNKEDGALRAKSVAYLADVLSSVAPKVLSGQERRLLCDFILGRLEGDTEGMGSSARALIALEERGKWDVATAQKVMKTLVDHVNPLKQFKLQTERYAVLELIDMLLAKYRKAVQTLSEDDPEFLPSFIAFFDGEKDPRNLMIVFSILQVPMTEWDIQASAQDLFDSVFNYFPITFKPPPDDPYGITAQQLKDRLRDCIAATSDFAPYAFPALLDKLDSTSMSTKRDVLQTLQACVASYESKTINLYSVTLWDALKFEVLAVQEEDLAQEALKGLGLIAAKFADGPDGPLNAYLRPVIKECNEHLEDAPTKQSQASGRILHAVASGAPVVADRIAKGTLPRLFELYRASDSLTKRRGLIEVYNQIVKAFIDLEQAGDRCNLEGLQASSEDALEALLRALLSAPKSEVSYRLASFNGLVQLVSLRGMLMEKEINRVVDLSTDIVLHENIEGHGDIRAEAIQNLKKMAHITPNAIRTQSIPAFMAELPDQSTDITSSVEILEAFAQLSTEPQIFDTIVLRLKNKFSAAKHQGAAKEYQHALLMALLYAFSFGSPLEDNGVVRSSYFTDFAEPLFLQIQSTSASDWDPMELDLVGRICNILLRPQTPHFQSAVYNTHMSWLSSITIQDEAQLRKFASFSLSYYAAIRPEVVDPQDILSLLQSQARAATNAGDLDAETGALLRYISLLVNKFISPKEMQATLQGANLDVSVLLSAAEPTPQSISLAFAVTKALVTQGKTSQLTNTYLKTLLHLLPRITKANARHFSTLLAPDDTISKQNHCIVSGLYKQKVFNQLALPLASAIRTVDQTSKPVHLIAFSGLLRWLPYSILQPSLLTLIAPLQQTLDASEQDLKASSLQIFENILMYDPTLLADHIASLVSRLLNCTDATSNKSAHVRARALQSLALVSKQLKREAVLRYRRQVVKRLAGCLDDKKRAVRSEAVKCRTAWLALEEAEEDE